MTNRSARTRCGRSGETDASRARQPVAGYFGLPQVSWFAGSFVTSYVAVLDIIRVFMVFKGDVRLT